jgi:2,3-bisphosphoglycerate-independent phosphoglycerate mutase
MQHDVSDEWERLARPGGRIAYLVMDGAGGLEDRSGGRTALQAARTPNLDRVVRDASCGLLELVGAGITPGSGPGHLALFGYHPLRYRIGRGVLTALGVDFDLRPGDVAARINFASADADGKLTDRRAGRLATNVNEQLCEKLRDAVTLDFEGEVFVETVAEHRALLVLRGNGLSGAITDTDPQSTGVAAAEPKPSAEAADEADGEAAERTATLIRAFVEQARAALADEPANEVLLRGFQRHEPLPTLRDRFGLRGLCIAHYPMYRGLSRLLGMQVGAAPDDLCRAFEQLEQQYGKEHDLYFLHVKGTDSSGEDGDFDRKVAVIEQVDALLPRLLALEPEVLVVTADHSTPAAMAAHSWHPVPVVVAAQTARRDGIRHLDEHGCRGGSLGLRPGIDLLGLAMAHAGRLAKFGA